MRIAMNVTEPVEVLVLDHANAPLPGLANVKLKIRRAGDGLFYDWADDTFRAAPAVLLQALAEVNAVRAPGAYHLSTPTHPHGWDTAKITNHTPNATYVLTVVQDGATTAANLPSVGEIDEGQWVTDVVVARKKLTNREELTDAPTDNLVTYDDDNVTPLLTATVTGPTGEAIVIPAQTPTRRSRGI